ncbi:hypothetical protein RRG08_028715 [Elysia crispata]|uniref:Uncharacterized protein n=1 Tax=Elysia crispata TaxID=231223 RepID=A0AAE1CLG8_9GAST|nr:hypothetical protein RRG08_028715 [Elysia crispata]
MYPLSFLSMMQLLVSVEKKKHCLKGQRERMLPKMKGTGYRQISSVFYVITLCCCLSLNVQGRTLGNLRSGYDESQIRPCRWVLVFIQLIMTSLSTRAICCPRS